ncbi:MAG: DUF6472 family protein [Clostridiales bacterium]|nr:DUF6472 family protein [Clostridiales bacterium]
MKNDCDMCMNYTYDEEYDCFTCSVDMDEDEAYSLFSNKRRVCPYFRFGDDYTIVRKQN